MQQLIFDTFRSVFGDYVKYWGISLLICLVWWKILLFGWNSARRGKRLFFHWSSILCAVILIVSCVVEYYLFDRRGLPAPFPEGQIGILVTPIPGDSDFRLQNSYATAIRDLLADTPDLSTDVKVELLERNLPRDLEKQHLEMVKIASRLRASLVVRPIRTAGGFDVMMDIVDLFHAVRSSSFPKSESSLMTMSEMQLANINKLSLPGDVLLTARVVLGFLYMKNANFPAAIEQLKTVINAKSTLKSLPATAEVKLALVNAYLSNDQRDAAVAEFTAMDRSKTDTFNVAITLNQIGIAWLDEPPWLISQSRFLEARSTFEGLPKSDETDGERAAVSANLGIVYFNRGESAKSKIEYTQALTVQDHLLAKDPNSIERLFSVAKTKNSLGNLALQMNDTQSAEQMFEDAISIKRHLVARDPIYRASLAMSLANEGNLFLQFKSRQSDARSRYQEAIEISRKLVAENPQHDGMKYMLARNLVAFAQTYTEADPQKAIEAYLEASPILQALIPKHGDIVLSTLAHGLVVYGDAFDKLGQTSLAKQDYEAALNIECRLAKGHFAANKDFLLLSTTRLAELQARVLRNQPKAFNKALLKIYASCPVFKEHGTELGTELQKLDSQTRRPPPSVRAN